MPVTDGTRRGSGCARWRGPNAYSQAMRVGNLLFTAGQPGMDPGTGAAAGATFETQARQAIANLRAVLEDAGSGLERVVKTTCFVADATAFPKLNELYAEYSHRLRPSAPRPLSACRVAFCSRSRRLPW